LTIGMPDPDSLPANKPGSPVTDAIELDGHPNVGLNVLRSVYQQLLFVRSITHGGPQADGLRGVVRRVAAFRNAANWTRRCMPVMARRSRLLAAVQAELKAFGQSSATRETALGPSRLLLANVPTALALYPGSRSGFVRRVSCEIPSAPAADCEPRGQGRPSLTRRDTATSAGLLYARATIGRLEDNVRRSVGKEIAWTGTKNTSDREREIAAFRRAAGQRLTAVALNGVSMSQSVVQPHMCLERFANPVAGVAPMRSAGPTPRTYGGGAERWSTAGNGFAQGGMSNSTEIHLDGGVLGRWIVRYLGELVTQPHAGITAVDPRLTPTWAGSPIGM